MNVGVVAVPEVVAYDIQTSRPKTFLESLASLCICGPAKKVDAAREAILAMMSEPAINIPRPIGDIVATYLQIDLAGERDALEVACVCNAARAHLLPDRTVLHAVAEMRKIVQANHCELVLENAEQFTFIVRFSQKMTKQELEHILSVSHSWYAAMLRVWKPIVLDRVDATCDYSVQLQAQARPAYRRRSDVNVWGRGGSSRGNHTVKRTGLNR